MPYFACEDLRKRSRTLSHSHLLTGVLVPVETDRWLIGLEVECDLLSSVAHCLNRSSARSTSNDLPNSWNDAKAPIVARGVTT